MYAKDLIDYIRRTIGEPRALCTTLGACRPSLEDAFKNQ
jgi:hypothetical protein